MRASWLDSAPRAIAGVVLAALLAGCGGEESEQESDQQQQQKQKEQDQEQQDGGDKPQFVNIPMIDETVRGLDPDAQRQNTSWQFRIQGYPVFVIADPAADRIRVQVPVTQTSRLTAKDWRRVMSANFGTAIDARYASAQNVLWSVFVHRLSTLTKADFHSGIRQCLNLMATYGTAYASMNSVFSGGDYANPNNGTPDQPNGNDSGDN